jgi:predicted acyltransferase
MILVNSAAFMFYAVDAPVFPAFVFMTGVSIPLALGVTAEGLTGSALRRLLVRAGRLFLLGVILSNIYWMATPDSVVFRPLGVLQRLALAFLAAAVLYKTLGPRARLIVAIALLALYWPLCLAPYPGGVADLATPGANLVGWIDRLVLGGHT